MNTKQILSMIVLLVLVLTPTTTAQVNTPYAGSAPGETSLFQTGVNTYEQLRQGLDSFAKNPTDLGEPIIVNVGDYEPKIVRASDLEQSEAPVFVHLIGISSVPDFNQPDLLSALTSIPPIKDITITPTNATSLKYVKNFRYIRPPQNVYSKNEFGYVVVNLKKIKNETDLPMNNSIDLQLQAKIFFDYAAGGALGIGQEEKTLHEETEQLFLDKPTKTDNAFFNKRAYIRAVTIEDDTATFQIYNKNLLPLSLLTPSNAPAGTPVATIRLHKGERTTSPINIQYSGNPLEDFIILQLNDISTPQDKAEVQITVNGRTLDRKLVKDQALFPGSQWFVDDKPQIIGRSPISLADATTTFSLTPTVLAAITSKYGATAQLEQVTHRLILKNKVTGERKALDRLTLGASGQFLSLNLQPISDSLADVLETKYCKFEEAGGSIIVRSTAALNLGCEALARYKQVLKQYPNTKQADNATEQIYHIYDGNPPGQPLIDYEDCDVTSAKGATPVTVRNQDSCKQFLIDMNLLKEYYAKKLNDEGILQYTQKSLTAIGGTLQIPEENVNVQLLNVDPLTDQDKGSVKLRIDQKDQDPVTVGQPLANVAFTPVDSTGRALPSRDWVVTEIHAKYVKVKAGIKENGQYRYTGEEQQISVGTDNLLPTKEEGSTVPGQPKQTFSVKVQVIDIKTKNEALVTIIPGGGNAFSTSTFNIHLSIEPRPFKLTPEQLRSQINATQGYIDTLDRWTKSAPLIGNDWIKNWKKTCLVTFGALVAKNAIFQGTTRAAARTQVSGFYKQKCQGILQKDPTKYTTFDSCLADQTTDMTKDIDATQAALDQAKTSLAGKKPAELDQCGPTINKVNYEFLKKEGATYDDCQAYLFSQEIQKSSSVSAEYKSYAQQQYQNVGFDTKLDALKKISGTPPTTPVVTAFGDLATAEVAYVDAAAQYTKAAPGTIVSLKDIRPVASAPGTTPTYAGFIPSTIPGTPPGTTTYTPKESADLVRLTQFQFQLYDQGDKFLTSLQDKFKSDQSLRQNVLSGQARDLDKETYFTNIVKGPEYGAPTNYFVEKSFLSTFTPAITTPPDPNYNLLHAIFIANIPILTDPTAAVAKPLVQSQPLPKDFHLYTSTTFQDSAQQIKSNQYTYLPGACNEAGRVLYAQTDFPPPKGEGLVFCYPTGEDGNYILVRQRSTGSRAVEDFDVMNVGPNQLMECGAPPTDDVLVRDHTILNRPENAPEKAKYLQIINKAQRCQKECQTIGYVGKANIPVKCSSQVSKQSSLQFEPKCIDVMEPSDCKILFNACDPVLCPPSRCNLAGRYHVDNVIQTGIVGSAMLCLPNAKDGVYVPVCLTGINAGLKNIQSILEGYKTCLEANLNEGKNIGFCGYIRDVGVCELVWREAYQLLNVGGTAIDILSNKLNQDPQGGVEYYNFQSTYKQAGESFNVFTNEYSTSFLAYYKGKSLGDIGTQLCRLQVNGNVPSVGDILDKLSEPENPPQYTGFFEEVPYANLGEVPVGTAGVRGVTLSTQKISLYKAFYHIYAGTGYAQSQGVLGEAPSIPGAPPGRAVTYSVYLKSKANAGMPPLYITVPGDDTFLQRIVNLEFGKSRQENIQIKAAAGYDEMCINVNGKESCGFGKVSSDFLVNELSDEVSQADAEKNVTTASQCTGEQAIGPTLQNLAPGGGLLSTGIVKVCNPTSPTGDTNRWKPVGNCGKDSTGLDRGTCWLDENSITIKDAAIREETKFALDKKGVPVGTNPNDLIKDADARIALAALNAQKKAVVGGLWAALKLPPPGTPIPGTGHVILSITANAIAAPPLTKTVPSCRVANCFFGMPNVQQTINDFGTMTIDGDPSKSYYAVENYALNPEIAAQAWIDEADGWRELASMQRTVEPIVTEGPKSTPLPPTPGPVIVDPLKEDPANSRIFEIDDGTSTVWNVKFKYTNKNWVWSFNGNDWKLVTDATSVNQWYSQLLSSLKGVNYQAGVVQIAAQAKQDTPGTFGSPPALIIYQDDGTTILGRYEKPSLDTNINAIMRNGIKSTTPNGPIVLNGDAQAAQKKAEDLGCTLYAEKTITNLRQKMIDNSYKNYITESTSDQGEQAILAGLLATESRGDPNAISGAGAKGVVQFTDLTAKGFKFPAPAGSIAARTCINPAGQDSCYLCPAAGCGVGTDGRLYPSIEIPAAQQLLKNEAGYVKNCNAILSNDIKYKYSFATENDAYLAAIAAYNGGHVDICRSIKYLVKADNQKVSFDEIHPLFYNQGGGCDANCQKERKCYVPKVLYYTERMKDLFTPVQT